MEGPSYCCHFYDDLYNDYWSGYWGTARLILINESTLKFDLIHLMESPIQHYCSADRLKSMLLFLYWESSKLSKFQRDRTKKNQRVQKLHRMIGAYSRSCKAATKKI